MPTYLITGANRGLGLEFARQLSQRKDDTRIIATAREVEKATDLARLVHDVIALDVADPKSIEKLPDLLKDRPIDVLINNAGVGSKAGPLDKLEADELQRVFTVNAFGPILVSKALLPNLRAGTRKTIFNITSQLGSIANNQGGSSYAYRGSKAALNMMTVSMSHELKKDGFTCVIAHPGWVQTDMGGPGAPLKPEDSITALLKVIDGLKPQDTGKYYNYDGTILPGEAMPISQPQARAFAESWYAAWNANDIGRIMAHYAPTIEHSSPFIKRYNGTDDTSIRGTAAVRDYFDRALKRNPTLRFDPLYLAIGLESVILVYKRMTGDLAAELFQFDPSGMVVRSISHYDLAPV